MWTPSELTNYCRSVHMPEPVQVCSSGNPAKVQSPHQRSTKQQLSHYAAGSLVALQPPLGLVQQSESECAQTIPPIQDLSGQAQLSNTMQHDNLQLCRSKPDRDMCNVSITCCNVNISFVHGQDQVMHCHSVFMLLPITCMLLELAQYLEGPQRRSNA